MSSNTVSSRFLSPSGLSAPVRQGWRLLAGLRSRGAWALADQGAISFGNFATNLLLAR